MIVSGAHVPFCQSSSQIALSCPACRWRLLQWSVPRPGQSFEETLPFAIKRVFQMTTSLEQPIYVSNAVCHERGPLFRYRVRQ